MDCCLLTSSLLACSWPIGGLLVNSISSFVYIQALGITKKVLKDGGTFVAKVCACTVGPLYCGWVGGSVLASKTM